MQAQQLAPSIGGQYRSVNFQAVIAVLEGKTYRHRCQQLIALGIKLLQASDTGQGVISPPEVSLRKQCSSWMPGVGSR